MNKIFFLNESQRVVLYLRCLKLRLKVYKIPLIILQKNCPPNGGNVHSANQKMSTQELKYMKLKTEIGPNESFVSFCVAPLDIVKAISQARLGGGVIIHVMHFLGTRMIECGWMVFLEAINKEYY